MNVSTAAWIMSAIFCLGGMISLLAALLNWEWFFRSEGVRMIVGRISRKWQRMIYAAVGLLMLCMAAHLITQV